MGWIIVFLVASVIGVFLLVSEKDKAWKYSFVAGTFLSVLMSTYVALDYKSGTPATEIKTALHSVCEVVQNYGDGTDNYAVIRNQDGSLNFVKTERLLSIGFYKFEREGNGVKVGGGVLVPFMEPERY